MQSLRQYLRDCEKKRRRMRDRPSNAVLVELRELVDHFEKQVGDSRSSGGVPRTHQDERYRENEL